MTLRRLAPALALVAATLFLQACTVTIVPDPADPRVDRPRIVVPVRSVVIERFESARPWYRVGDRVSFRIRTNQSGFVTLTAFDPDGTAYVIARNVPVFGNRIETIPQPLGRTSFVAAPPTGPHLVRAHFTPERTPERVSFRGIASLDAWTNAISLEIRGFGYTVDDIAEVRFDVLR
jgi:hypothetical protein